MEFLCQSSVVGESATLAEKIARALSTEQEVGLSIAHMYTVTAGWAQDTVVGRNKAEEVACTQPIDGDHPQEGVEAAGPVHGLIHILDSAAGNTG